MNLGTCAARYIGKRVGPVIYGIQAAAAIRILYVLNVVCILGLVELVPFVVDEEFERGRRHDAFEEQSGEDGGYDCLEALEDDGSEACEDIAGCKSV